MNESYTIKSTALEFKPDNAWLSTRVVIDISEQTLDKLSKIFSPVQHGYWISHDYDFAPAESTQECSVCHKEQPIYMVDDNYCPHCGAQMDKERKEND